MKKTKIIYWIFTGIFVALMLFAAITEIMNKPDAAAFITKLGYPAYLNPFLGITKLLGAIAMLIPGFRRIKEWAYAGFTIDLVGATYSMIAIGTPATQWVFMLIWIVLLFVSYIFYHKKLAGN